MMNKALSANEATVTLTEANLDHDHLYITQARHLLPPDVYGGDRKSDPSSRLLTITFEPGQTVQTDVPNGRNFFRERSAVADFFQRTGAAPGDEVRIVRTGPYKLRISPVSCT